MNAKEFLLAGEMSWFLQRNVLAVEKHEQETKNVC